MGDPTKIGVEITAKDGSGKGFGSAEKRAVRFSKVSARSAKDGGGAAARSFSAAEKSAIRFSKSLPQGRSFARSFGAMERAASQSLGRRSITSAIGERYGGVAHASGLVSGAGSAEAAAVEGLGGALGKAAAGLGLFAGAVLAAGLALYGQADKWSKAGASLGRLSQSSDIAAKDLFAIGAVAERYGATKEQGQDTAAGLADRLNDTLYGRDTQTAGLLNQLGVEIKKGADGAPDVAATLPAIADAIARQTNPMTQKLIAAMLGVTSMLPILRKGGAAYTAEVEDAKKYAPSKSDAQVAQDQRTQRDVTAANQVVEKAGGDFLAGSGDAYEKAAGAAVGAAHDGLDGAKQLIADAPKRFSQAAASVGPALTTVTHALDEGGRRIATSMTGVEKAFGAGAARFAEAAVRGGEDLIHALTVARIETGGTFNPQAQSKLSSAKGMVQILKGSAPSYGILASERGDPEKAGGAFARGDGRNAAILQRRLGREISPWERYLAWQQGAGGAQNILQGDQQRRAVDVLGEAQVRKNIPAKDFSSGLTLEQFQAFWEKRYAANRDRVVQGLKDNGGATAPAKVEVAIRMTGAPPGTVTRITGGGPNVAVSVGKAMDGP